NRSAKYATTVSVVVNGSPTPIVIGLTCDGTDLGRAFLASRAPWAMTVAAWRSADDRFDEDASSVAPVAICVKACCSEAVSLGRPESPCLAAVDVECGSALLSTSSSAWFCQKQTPRA